MTKKIFITITAMLSTTTLMANYNYDTSTVAAQEIGTPVYTKPSSIVFPASYQPSLRESLTEMKSYAEAVGRRFSYTLKDKKAKRAGPIAFQGGTIHDLKNALRKKNLYSRLTSASSIEIFSTRTLEYSLRGLSSTSELVSQIRNTPGVKKVIKRKQSMTVIMTPRGESIVRDAIEMHTEENRMRAYQARLESSKGKEKILNRLRMLQGVTGVRLTGQNLVTYSATERAKTRARLIIKKHNRNIGDKRARAEEKIEERARAKAKSKKIAQAKTKTRKEAEAKVASTKSTQIVKVVYKTATPQATEPAHNTSQGIVLDQPYTVRSFVKKLSPSNKSKYLVEFDANIPVEKGTRINGIGDLNRYLKRKTGRGLNQKKLPSGNIIISKDGGK